jgi:hypothetical protein
MIGEMIVLFSFDTIFIRKKFKLKGILVLPSNAKKGKLCKNRKSIDNSFP